MRESTEKSNIVKLLMNYCPMEHVPEQLQWGHEKEIAASELYLKKISKKHKLKEENILVLPNPGPNGNFRNSCH